MALQYTGTLTGAMILADMEAHADWHGQVIRRAFFPDAPVRSELAMNPPMTLVDWCEKEVAEKRLERKLVERFLGIHRDVISVAGALLETRPPTIERFDDFERTFEAYIHALQRLEQDLLAVTTSIDPVTGLRSAGGMWNELRREMDRRERKGDPFCLCAVSIDRLHDLQSRFDRRGMERISALTAGLLAAALRSFDDAYYLGGGEFLLCLKHVDPMDAFRAMERIRVQIEDTDMNISHDRDAIRLTVSIGMCEPVLGDKIETVVANARKAMEIARSNGGNRIHEYEEVSPLVQYARDVRTDY